MKAVQRARLKIGGLAKAAGVSRDTIRFYERERLLPPAGRTASRHRLYDEETARTLLFIRKAQELGLTLSDIRALLSARELPDAERGRVVATRLRHRMDEHDRKIASLRGERDRLRKMLARCEASRGHDCPLMSELEGGPPGATRRSRRAD